MLDPDRDRGWFRFAAQVQKDAQFWLVTLVLLTAFRAILFAANRQEMASSSTVADAIKGFINGSHYDSQIACYVVLPSLFLTLLCLIWPLERVTEVVRWLVALLFMLALVVVGRIDLGYFKEYHDQFDHFVLGAFFDDRAAIVGTISKEYRLGWEAAGMLMAVAVGVCLLWLTLRRPWIARRMLPTRFHSVLSRGVCIAAVVVVAVIGLRGSATRRPLQEKDAAVTADPFLNRIVFNPFTAIRYAADDYFKLSGAGGLRRYLPDGDIRAAAALIQTKPGPLRDIDDALLRVAPGPRGRPPRHIFLIVMESYDAWPLLDRYASLGIAEHVKQLGARGIRVQPFISASSGTMISLAAIITGLADAGVMTNYRPSTRKPFPSSIAPIFKKLGYRTRMFYSGYLSWQRIGEFCHDQGFDEVYGGGTIGPSSGNEWGVDDDVLFDFIAKTIRSDEPSFSMIMTTSNHPPYSVDVVAKGFPLKAVPPDLANMAGDGDMDLNMLGHFWFADRAVGNFVERVTRELPMTVCAITGDHWSRKFIGPRPTLYEHSSVPLVLYGPGVLEGVKVPDPIAGSHLDIVPTLVGLAAPAGFEFHAMGTDMLDPAREEVGFERSRGIGPDFIFSDALGRRTIEAVPGKPLTKTVADIDTVFRKHDAVEAVAWWRIMKGAELPAEGQKMP